MLHARLLQLVRLAPIALVAVEHQEVPARLAKGVQLVNIEAVAAVTRRAHVKAVWQRPTRPRA